MKMVWPDWLDRVLAKSADKGEGGKPETLSQHTWDVLQKFSEITRLRSNLPFQVNERRLWQRLFWACLLHDLGKSAKGFQDVLYKRSPKWSHRHEVLSLAFVEWLFPRDSQDWIWVISAIASHHKDVLSLQEKYPNDLNVDDDAIPLLIEEISDETLSGIWDWLDRCPRSWVSELDLEQSGIEFPNLIAKDEALVLFRKNGASSIHYALGAFWDTESEMYKNSQHPLKLAMILLRGHIISSDHMASAHVGELPTPQLADAKALLVDWKLSVDDLYEHQRECLSVNGSAVLMAPTGSGKTEASLLWAVSQAQDNHSVPRLYYTLPFQASMNAMFKRLNDDDDENKREAPFKNQVGLEHSRSTLAYYRRLLIENEDADPKETAKAAKWLKNLAKLNYYPVRVLSPYQLLKAPYRLKGYETLLTDCFDATFIFDEVHAYEAGRLAKVLALVKYLREQYHAKFFMMSATLPNLLRERLSNVLGDYKLIQASPDLYAQFRRHALILKDGDLLSDVNLDRIAKVAESGQAVLVCCNTVPRSQDARTKLMQRLGDSVEVLLLHGRFNGKDRLNKEDVVREATGSRSKKRRSLVLVATQVVEVSLDIDLDVIYTDPAPLEALLQRFGRINRRRLKECAPVCVFREPVPDKPRPYEPGLINAALQILDQHKDTLIDEAQVSNWLDEVYSRPEIAEPWIEEYEREYEEFCDNALSTLRAFQSSDELEDVFYKAFDSVDVLPEGLYNDYLSARETSPLEASQLLVPLRWQQYAILKGKGRAREEEDGKLKLVDVHYDSKIGLDLSREAKASPKDVWDND